MVRDERSALGVLRPGGPVLRLAAVLAIVLGSLSVVAHALEYRGVERYSKDFALDYSSAHALRDGVDPYLPIRELVGRYLNPPRDVLENNVLPGGNWHPPFKVAITVPLSFLPYQTAGVLWVLISAACIVAAVFLFGTALGWRRRTALIVGIGALAIPVAQIDLSAGQLNGPLLLLMVAMWRSIRSGSETGAGIALGVAASLKFFPAFMGLPLLGLGKRRAVAVGAATFVVLTFAGFAAAGLSSAGDHVQAIRSEGLGYWETSPANIAWWGIAKRWLSTNPWVTGGFDVGALATAFAVAGTVLFTVAAIRPGVAASGDRLWSAAPLMLLAWPVVWNHYLLLALPWVVLSLRRAFDERDARPPIALGMVGIVMMMGLPPGLDPIHRASDLQVALGYQLPTFALLAAVMRDARRVREPTVLPEPVAEAR